MGIHRVTLPTGFCCKIVLQCHSDRRVFTGLKMCLRAKIFHLLRWPVVGLVTSRWARLQWPFVRVPKQVVRRTYFPICWLGVSGLGGRTAHVVLQD